MSSADGNKDHALSRKNKSLGLLCSNFIDMYNREGVKFIDLGETASQLGVERRRIYDVVNVLECVGVLSRKAVNQYSWKGFDGIPQALEALKDSALRGKFGTDIRGSDGCLKALDNDENEAFLDQGGDGRRTLKFNSKSDLEAPPVSSLSSTSKAENRREKSLGLLTQNLLKLFLTMNANKISLDEASNLLLGNIYGSSQMKTKVRRLYDIANVLASMNLIEKTYQTESRKPAYKWLGFKGRFVNDAVFSSGPPDPQPPKKRSFGTDITNIEFVKKSKLNSSVDKKPVKKKMKSDDSSAQRNCTHLQQQQQQQQSSKGSFFGPFQPTGSHDTGRKGVKKNQEWKTLPSSYHPEYHNPALSDLFAHYVEAWKSWYAAEVAQGNKKSRNTNYLPS